MTKKAREPSNMEEAGMKTDDALYKNEQMGNDKDLQQKDGNRQDDGAIMDSLNSQQGIREHQEQFRHNGQSGGARSSEDEQEPEHQFYGYNIARDDDQDGRLTNNFEEKNRDPNPEKQVDEYFQRYNQDDPLEKHT